MLSSFSAESSDNARDFRRETIIGVARAAFFANGYGATSMSAIAATLGGSKTTLWGHFRGKNALFEAVIDDVLARHCGAIGTSLPPEVPVAATLERFGAVLMSSILSTPMIELHRLVTSEAGRFPEIAARYRARGPHAGTDRLADYLNSAMADGRLRSGDSATAAEQFVALCQSRNFQRLVLGIGPAPDADGIARDVARAVDAMLRIWGPD